MNDELLTLGQLKGLLHGLKDVQPDDISIEISSNGFVFKCNFSDGESVEAESFVEFLKELEECVAGLAPEISDTYTGHIWDAVLKDLRKRRAEIENG